MLIHNKIAPTVKFDSSGRAETVWVEYEKNFTGYPDYRTKQFRPPVEPLSQDGISALKKRRDDLLERIRENGTSAREPYDGDPQEGILHAFDKRDEQLMSAYERFLTKDNQHDMEASATWCVLALRAMGCTSISETLTLDHIEIGDLLWDAVPHSNGLLSYDDYCYFHEGLLWVTFQNMKFADRILSLVRDDGITDIKLIIDTLPEITASHLSLCEGAL